VMETPDDDVVAPEPTVAVDVPDEVVAEGLAASAGGESFDDLLIEANAEDERDTGGESFDLAAELAGALDDDTGAGATNGSMASMSEQDVFSAVFSEFKKGVDKTLGEGDHEARYDLGIAYREMGLLDDALSEFRAASSSPARRVDCLQMLGLCAIDMGRAEEATVHLQEALATPDLNREQSLGLRFELGRAFEALEDLDRAREAWQAVAAVDPTFCEVSEHLASLGQAKPEPEEGGLENFEDLFADDDDDDTGGATAADSAGESFDDLVAEANLDDEPGETQDLSVEDATPLPESQPAVEAPVEPEAARKPRRRKKKISFV